MRRYTDRLLKLEKTAEATFANKMGWDGDQMPARYFSLPVGNGVDFGYVVKQRDHGKTFVAAPVPLDHLNDVVCGPKCVVEY